MGTQTRRVARRAAEMNASTIGVTLCRVGACRRAVVRTGARSSPMSVAQSECAISFQVIQAFSIRRRGDERRPYIRHLLANVGLPLAGMPLRCTRGDSSDIVGATARRQAPTLHPGKNR